MPAQVQLRLRSFALPDTGSQGGSASLSRRHKLGSHPKPTRRPGASTMTIDGNGEGNLTGSLAGLRVLDFSTTIAGPHCTRMLADMGAEVIKIETAEGETMRTRLPVRNNCSTAFGQLNVGKQSF